MPQAQLGAAAEAEVAVRHSDYAPAHPAGAPLAAAAEQVERKADSVIVGSAANEERLQPAGSE